MQLITFKVNKRLRISYYGYISEKNILAKTTSNYTVNYHLIFHVVKWPFFPLQFTYQVY